jgi:glucoamylase
VLRWLRTLRAEHGRPNKTVSEGTLANAERLLRIDLALTATRWREPSWDIWEEELGLPYYTLRVSAAALNEGAEWLGAAGEATEATALRTEARAILETLDRFWLEDAGYYQSRIMPPGGVDQNARHRGDPRRRALR